MPFEKGVIPEGAKPFQPGQSGNPAGYPKGMPHTATRMLRWLSLEIEQHNPSTDEKERMTIMEAMDLAMVKKAMKGNLKAYNSIIDRIEGRTIQRTEMSGPNGSAIPVRYTGIEIVKPEEE